jgi:hypothetical protein
MCIISTEEWPREFLRQNMYKNIYYSLVKNKLKYDKYLEKNGVAQTTS